MKSVVYYLPIELFLLQWWRQPLWQQPQRGIQSDIFKRVSSPDSRRVYQDHPSLSGEKIMPTLTNMLSGMQGSVPSSSTSYPTESMTVRTTMHVWSFNPHDGSNQQWKRDEREDPKWTSGRVTWYDTAPFIERRLRTSGTSSFWYIFSIAWRYSWNQGAKKCQRPPPLPVS